MTVVTFRDGVLASDSLVLNGTRRVGLDNKLRRIAGGRCATIGASAASEALLVWLEGGRKDVQPTEGSLVWVPDGERPRKFHDGREEPPVDAPFWAWGSGAGIAIGAMARGASAEEAVVAAIAWETQCGGPVCVLGPAEA